VAKNSSWREAARYAARTLTILQSIVLGIVQGLTEFLPISSTAHLRIVPALLGWPDAGAAFTAVIQLGTLLAVILFFLRDLLGMVTALADPKRRRGPEGRMVLYLVVGTVPIGLAGVLLRHAVEGPLRTLTVIATSLIVIGLVMALVERLARHERAMESLTLRDALIIGLGQALALVPGVSRSGITLAVAMAIGLRREAAARFSFLLSIPAVGAAAVFELPKLLHNHDVGISALLTGLAAAGMSGYLCIRWLLRFLRTRTTYSFVIYRVALGLSLLAAVLAGKLA
jgi:undecaprenyl-diphosphatase